MKFLERLWWLRFGAISFHASLFLRVRLALVPILICFTRRKIASDEAYRLFATKLLALAACGGSRGCTGSDLRVKLGCFG